MPTPLPLLPVLSHIESPHIRREFAKDSDKDQKDNELPIHQDGIKTPCLKSGKPLLYRAEKFTNVYTNSPNIIQTEWHEHLTPNGELVSCPSMPLLGMENPHKIWVCLNRIRTGQERCNQLLNK